MFGILCRPFSPFAGLFFVTADLRSSISRKVLNRMVLNLMANVYVSSTQFFEVYEQQFGVTCRYEVRFLEDSKC